MHSRRKIAPDVEKEAKDSRDVQIGRGKLDQMKTKEGEQRAVKDLLTKMNEFLWTTSVLS